MTLQRIRPSTLTLLGGALLMLLLAVFAYLSAMVLRQAEVQAWRQQLGSMNLLLAEHTTQSMSSAELLLDRVALAVSRPELREPGELRRAAAGAAMHELLRERAAALPLVDVVTIVADDGEVLNYSRGWPVQPINVADRDYFKALRDQPGLRTYISEPVLAKTTGRWVYFMARRLSDAQGRFAGLVQVGLSVDALTTFFERVADRLGPGTTVTLLRSNFTLLARYPFADALMGKANLTGTTHLVVAAQRKTEDVVVHDGPRSYAIGDGLSRMAAVRVVERYPLIVNITVPESLYLERWRRSVRTLAWSVGGSLLLFGPVLLALVRSQRRREADEQTTLALRLQAEAASAASEAKTQFLSVMSHELRTPLNGVIGANRLLLDSPLSERQRELARTAALSADALLALIDDVLDLSRIEAGKLDLEQVDFDLCDLVDDAIEVLAPRARDKRLTLLGGLDPDVPDRIQGDPWRLRQVLLNLVGNAVKFTDAGEVSLHVGRKLGAGDVELLSFEIVDTGPGIAAGQIGSLFKRFSQLDTGGGRHHGGTGLGLAISKRLVELMGGAIGVDSVVGEGSRFRFELPLRRAVAAATTGRPSWQGLGGRRVLLVDGCAQRRAQLTALLARGGCEALDAASADDALARLRAEHAAGRRIDVAIADAAFIEATAGGDGEASLGDAREAMAEAAGGSAPPLLVLTPIGAPEPAPGGDPLRIELPEPVRRRRLVAALRRALQIADPAEPASPWSAAEPKPRSAAASSLPCRVLLVEDNEVNRMIAEQMLRQAGMQVDCAGSGQQALDCLADERFDVVLMDCQMSGMDGAETTRRIRSGAGGVLDPQVPIVALTANVMSADRAAAMAAGMNDFLPKPIDRDRLVATVLRWSQHHEPA